MITLVGTPLRAGAAGRPPHPAPRAECAHPRGDWRGPVQYQPPASRAGADSLDPAWVPEKSRSTVQPGPIAPLDEETSGATLIDWAAWAASTTFSSTGLGFGYDKREVDAFRSTVRDMFLGGAVFWVSTPPVKSDDVRGKQLPTQRPRY